MIFYVIQEANLNINSKIDDFKHSQRIESGLKNVLNISHTLFEECISYQNGGAIYTISNINIIMDTKFINNVAHNYGGAIYAENFTYFNISDSLFESNQATQIAGAVYMNGESLLIFHSYFTKNSAREQSGNIFCNCDTHIKFSTFESTHNTRICSGITSNKFLRIINCIFKNMSAIEKNAGLYLTDQSGLTTIDSCSFSDMSAPWQGISILSESQKDVLIQNSNFDQAKEKMISGSIKYASGNSFRTSNSKFSKFLIWYLLGFVPIAVFLSMLKMFVPLCRAKKRNRSL